MTAEIVDLTDYKYTKIAEKFVEIREKSSSEAAQYARETVPSEHFHILSKYIEQELIKRGEYEPKEGL